MAKNKFISIKILDWNKWYPNQSKANWFTKIDNNIFWDSRFVNQNPRVRILFIYLLIEASRHNNDGSLNVLSSLCIENCNLYSQRNLFLYIQCLVDLQLIHELNPSYKIREEKIREVKNRVVEEPLPSVANPNCISSLNPKRKVQTEIPNNELYLLYKLYPRKEGKTPGIKKLTTELKNTAEADKPKFLTDLELAITNYASKMKNEKTEIKYIQKFSRFAGEWRDHLESEEPKQETYIPEWRRPNGT